MKMQQALRPDWVSDVLIIKRFYCSSSFEDIFRLFFQIQRETTNASIRAADEQYNSRYADINFLLTGGPDKTGQLCFCSLSSFLACRNLDFISKLLENFLSFQNDIIHQKNLFVLPLGYLIHSIRAKTDTATLRFFSNLLLRQHESVQLIFLFSV